MRFLLAILAIAASTAAQSQNSTYNQTLVSVLTNNPNLTNLTTLFANQPGVFDLLNQVTNVTFLAPSNAAFGNLLANSSTTQALYNTSLGRTFIGGNILNGTYKSSQITSTPLFIPTHLTDKMATNVTGGQRIEAINSNGAISFFSCQLTKSTVTQADIPFNGGIIHVVDTPLLQGSSVTNTSILLNLTALAGAVTQTNLAETVDNTPDLTIFAPNNAAFQDIASVLANASIDTLKSVLSYHVVKGKVLYSPLIGNGSVQTLGGGSITTTVVNGSVFVNQARVVTPNVLVANGVVHVIDSVLNPNNASALPGSGGTGFANATSSSAVPFTSGVPTPTSSIPAGVTSSASSSSSVGLAARAMPTGAIGAGMLFAGAFMAF